MRQLRILVACICVAAPLAAQETVAQPAQATSAVPLARLEVVQSPVARTFTFRLDRYTGRVWQFTNSRGSEWQWEETPVPELVPVANADRPRFQLLVSSLALSQTILVDTETGKSWHFRKDDPTYSRERSRNGYGWEVVLDR